MVAKRKRNINCNWKENGREGKGEAFRFRSGKRGEWEVRGMRKTGKGEGEEREGRKVMGAA